VALDRAAGRRPRGAHLGQGLGRDSPEGRADQVWAGYDTGKVCSACDLSTTVNDIEYEVDMKNGRTFVFHQPCLTFWHQERATYLRP